MDSFKKELRTSEGGSILCAFRNPKNVQISVGGWSVNQESFKLKMEKKVHALEIHNLIPKNV